MTGDSVTLGKVFYPCVVKASKGEDTKGVRLAKDQQSFLAALEHALSLSDQVIVERCVYFSVLEGSVRKPRRASPKIFLKSKKKFQIQLI